MGLGASFVTSPNPVVSLKTAFFVTILTASVGIISFAAVPFEISANVSSLLISSTAASAAASFMALIPSASAFLFK